MATVLVADDEPEIQEMLRYLLEQAGHTVVSFNHGKNTWDYLKTCPSLDLVILDIMLPGMDGYSLLAALSELKDMKPFPIIIASVLGSAKNLFDRFPQVHSFIEKPFQPEEFMKKVNTALSKGSL